MRYHKQSIMVVLAALLLGSAPAIPADWSWSGPYLPSSHLADIWGAAPDDIYAVGEVGTILHYDGNGWYPLAVLTGEDLEDIHGTGPDNIFAVGANGTVLHWDGQDWSILPAPSPYIELYSVLVLAADSVYAGAAEGIVFHWNGSSWTTLATPAGEPVVGIAGRSASDIFAVTYGSLEDARFLHYDGTTWSLVTAPESAYAESVWVAPDGQAYACGYMFYAWNGAGWGARCGGYIWRDVNGLAADDVYAIGVYGLLHWDGFECTYSQPPIEKGQAVWAAAPDNVYVVGAFGCIQHYDGAAWTVVNFPDIDFEGVGGAGSQVFAAGDGGVARFDGSVWTVDDSGVTRANLTSVWAAAPNDAFACGYEGALIHWNGATWSPMEAATWAPYRDVWGTATDDVWAVSAQSGAISHWDGGTWSTLTDDYFPDLFGVWGSGPNDVYAVGRAATNDTGYMHWNGAEWSTVDFGFDGCLRAVHGFAADDVYAVGDNGLVLHWDGANWTDMAAITSVKLEGIWGRAPHDLYVVGDLGTILHWDGSSWAFDWSGTRRDLLDVWGSDTGDLWIAGQGGTLLHAGGPPVPTPTPQPGGVGCRLTLDDADLQAGDRVHLVMEGWNYSAQDLQVFQCVVLEAGGEYFFGGRPNGDWDPSWPWPEWLPEPDFPLIVLHAGQTFADTILDFVWPTGAGTGAATFYAGFLDPVKNELVGDIAWVDFTFD